MSCSGCSGASGGGGAQGAQAPQGSKGGNPLQAAVDGAAQPSLGNLEGSNEGALA